MLTAEEEKEIKEELANYPTRQAVSIDAMMVVQRHRGWVSDESIRDIGQLLGMSTADLDGVATFYNLIRRKPVARHVALICDSVSCWIPLPTAYSRQALRFCEFEIFSLQRFFGDFTFCDVHCHSEHALGLSAG